MWRQRWPVRAFDYVNLGERVLRTGSFLYPGISKAFKKGHNLLQGRNRDITQKPYRRHTRKPKFANAANSTRTNSTRVTKPSMVFRRNFRSRRTFHTAPIRGRARLTAFRRSTFRGGRGSTARTVRHMMNRVVEWKHKTQNQLNVGITTAGTILDLSVIAQGQTDQTRIGDQLNMASMSFRGHVYGNIADTVPRNVRLIAFQWNNDTAPAVADILIVTAGLETSATYNTDNARMYKIRYDRVFKTNNVVASGQFMQNIKRKVVIPYDDRKVKYSAGGTAGTGKMYWLQISTAGANFPSLSVEWKINFSDP